MAREPVKVVLGVASVGTPTLRGETAMKFINAFNSHGHVELDTAAMYPPGNPGLSEPELAGAPSWAVISTKLPSSFTPGAQSGKEITKSLAEGLGRLQKKQVDILYLHFPDSTVPFEDTLEAVDKAYKAGKLKRFGLSNFSPAQVKEVLTICEEKGYVKPSVYQGQYNLLARKPEEELMPLLRSNGISFYAYAPAAGGLLTGKPTPAYANESGNRWSKDTAGGAVYSVQYHQDPILAAVDKIREAAKKHGIEGHAVALRWALHHSYLSKEYGDAIIIGASKIEQLEQNLQICDAGPLPKDLVETIESVWPSVKENAPWAWMDPFAVKEFSSLRASSA